VKFLVNDVWVRTIMQPTIKVARTISTPIPTFTVSVQDNASSLAFSEMQECLILDDNALANQTHNLVLNPALNPYTTDWTAVSYTGITLSQASGGGVTLTYANTAIQSGQSLYQNTVKQVQGGQPYMFSVFVSAASPVNIKAQLLIQFFSANGIGLGLALSTAVVPSGTPAVLSVSATADTNAVYAQISVMAYTTNQTTNSGTITYSQVQCEPMTFASDTKYNVAYPTPWCASGQTNCYVLPDGTCVRQARLFGGLLTKALTKDNVGRVRTWDLTVSGYGWLLQNGGNALVSATYTNQADSAIITSMLSTYLPGVFSTKHVTTGATLTIAPNYDTIDNVLNNLGGNSGFFYFVDDYLDLWYQQPGYTSQANSLSDSPDGITSYPYYTATIARDGTQLGNACLVTGATGISAIVYDLQSIGYYQAKLAGKGTGMFWRKVSDSSLTTTAACQQRGQAEISLYNYGRVLATLTTNVAMVPGTTCYFTSQTDNLLNVPLLVQKVTIVMLGVNELRAPVLEYQCELGAYNPDMVNLFVKLHRLNTVTNQSIGTPSLDVSILENPLYYQDFLSISVVAYNPGTYNHGVYGVNTYFTSTPSQPSTTYGVGKYGDSSRGYN